jgi:hypothetical protein
MSSNPAVRIKILSNSFQIKTLEASFHFNSKFIVIPEKFLSSISKSFTTIFYYIVFELGKITFESNHVWLHF